MLKNLKKRLKTYFLTGLLVVVPIGMTIYLLRIVIGLADSLFALLPQKFHPNNYLPFSVPGLGLLITIILIFTVGIITTNIIGRKLVGFGERVVDKIPLVRGVYVALKQMMESLFSAEKSSFKKVVMVEYPRRGLFSVGFVTGVARGEIQNKTSKVVLNVFIPTSPNPTSGYLIMVPEEDAIVLEMEVETAFKMVLSGGMLTSDNQWKGKHG